MDIVDVADVLQGFVSAKRSKLYFGDKCKFELSISIFLHFVALPFF